MLKAAEIMHPEKISTVADRISDRSALQAFLSTTLFQENVHVVGIGHGFCIFSFICYNLAYLSLKMSTCLAFAQY